MDTEPAYSGLQIFKIPDGLRLVGGATLSSIELAYETWGTLSPKADNAVLICHALSGDSHVADSLNASGEVVRGWWSDMVGPGRAIDTTKYYIIGINALGGCGGSTGPSSLNPATGHRWGLDFPVVTIEDMVSAQSHLIKALGIEKLLAVVGGSLGGMQALSWTRQYPDMVKTCIASATTWRISAQSIGFNEVGRRAIVSDPDFRNGHYDLSRPPAQGLAIARMIGHITYLSDESMANKFGRRLRNSERSFGFGTDFEVESYLDHQGRKFVDRFDANSYLYLTRAMDYFSLADDIDNLTDIYRGTRVQFLLLSFSSDWLFPTYQKRDLHDALLRAGAEVSFVEVQSSYGHDAFLLEVERQRAFIEPFLHWVCFEKGDAV